MSSLNELKPKKGSRSPKRRLARGIGSGLGKTAGRGTKGQKARRTINPAFEGGQTPIHRRLPVKKGFRNINHKEFAVVNLDDLQKHFDKDAEVTPEALVQVGIVGNLRDGVKVLGFGELTKKLNVRVHRYSKSARAAIEAAGGKAETL